MVWDPIATWESNGMLPTGEAPISGGGVGGCERLEQALRDCHRRVPDGPARRSACRHLNRSLAECLVATACPNEAEAVRTLCSTAGTALKRSQCQQAKFSLSFCLSSLQL
ncbi:uncharacterized protein LOC111012670 [Momordica charantia]|uniref:Uncharacterized protein LOC111012670 n=1 Tax=Momordica charantia TaxID=3673 RepID=A0A6J1CN74_MOMCH|nr:uncharacterized protein LOC111012670 [Momordica charantia]